MPRKLKKWKLAKKHLEKRKQAKAQKATEYQRYKEWEKYRWVNQSPEDTRWIRSPSQTPTMLSLTQKLKSVWEFIVLFGLYIKGHPKH